MRAGKRKKSKGREKSGTGKLNKGEKVRQKREEGNAK